MLAEASVWTIPAAFGGAAIGMAVAWALIEWMERRRWR